jgi:hypothetical protein
VDFLARRLELDRHADRTSSTSHRAASPEATRRRGKTELHVLSATDTEPTVTVSDPDD